jgi:hypothetical protein
VGWHGKSFPLDIKKALFQSACRDRGRFAAMGSVLANDIFRGFPKPGGIEDCTASQKLGKLFQVEKDLLFAPAMRSIPEAGYPARCFEARDYPVSPPVNMNTKYLQ